MSLRMLDLAFRHKVLLVVPLLLGLVLGIAWFVSSMEDEYESSASISAKRPDYSPSAFEYNPYISVAQNQTNAMTQWLTTRDFTKRVVDRANADAVACLPAQVTSLDLVSGTAIRPTGDTLVLVTHRTKNSCLAKPVVNALLTEYKTFFGELIQTNATADIEILSAQLERARLDEEAASQAYNEYIRTRPELFNIDPESPTASTVGDAQFAQLLQSLETARSITNRIGGLLAQAQFAASPEGQAQGFQVVDDPEEPTAPLALGSRAIMTKPIMGMAAGLLVSASVFFILWRTDRAVRLPSDLAFLGTSAPVMTLPSLRTRRRHWPQSFVRLAAGITSGLTHLG